MKNPVWSTVGNDTYALAESPFWHPQEQQLYWVDISGKKLLRMHASQSGVEAWDMPSEPGCMAPAAKGGLVVALRDGVYRARNWGGTLERIVQLPYDTSCIRANDGKCDTLGRFWIGTIDEPKAGRAAELFSLDCRSGAPLVTRQAGDALTANGLAWSPSNRVLYWADTPSHVVHAWDFDVQANALSAHRTHLQFAPKPQGWTFEDTSYQGRPDGAAVDVQGNYWVAMYEGRRVCQFAPDGSLLQELETPAQCPTMPCFGGQDLQMLYVTSAGHGRSAAELAQFPASGAVFATRVEVSGLPVNAFAD
jgi:sugar lactone lactonase YvrE